MIYLRVRHAEMWAAHALQEHAAFVLTEKLAVKFRNVSSPQLLIRSTQLLELPVTSTHPRVLAGS